MAWITPAHSRSKVDAAGSTLLRRDPLADMNTALTVVNNWRSSHAFPLQVMKMTLLGRAVRVDAGALVSQRLKRLHSIVVKLRENPHMKLSQMQDIGGCRAVLSSAGRVDALVALYDDAIARNPGRGSERLEKYDYILSPKPDGYRSVHLVYKYRSQSSKNVAFNRLRVEIQIRSRQQHVWATAYETVTTFTGLPLRSDLNERWQRLFALMGSAFAIKERRARVPGTPADPNQMKRELRGLARELNAVRALQGWGVAAQNLTQVVPDAAMFLMVLNPSAKSLEVTPYKPSDLARAQEDYQAAEQRIRRADSPREQAVLVSVDDLAALRRAYPNYYLDTRRFIRALQAEIA